MMTKKIAMTIALAAVTGLAVAQQSQPRGKAEATINGKKVVIDYGRPALKGRTIDALMKDLPEDRIWRAGENQVTTIDTQTGLNVGGKPVPAGKYSLYVHAPAQGDWALVINKNLGIPLVEIWAEARWLQQRHQGRGRASGDEEGDRPRSRRLHHRYQGRCPHALVGRHDLGHHHQGRHLVFRTAGSPAGRLRR